MNFPVSFIPNPINYTPDPVRWIPAIDIKVEFPWSPDEIIHELESETWTSVIERERRIWPNDIRQKCYKPKSKLLNEIRNRLISDEIKYEMVNTMMNTIGMYNWGCTAEQLAHECMILGEFTKDLPGYKINPHIDVRRQVSTAMVFLNKDPKPETATYVCDSRQGENKKYLPHGFGEGWVLPNGEYSFHGAAENNEDRYSIFLPIFLKFELFNDFGHLK